MWPENCWIEHSKVSEIRDGAQGGRYLDWDLGGGIVINDKTWVRAINRSELEEKLVGQEFQELEV